MKIKMATGFLPVTIQVFEATRGFEPLMRVLQTLALPLGHVAMQDNFLKHRAGDGTRTHDLLLGKEVFYQLNYTRNVTF